MAHIYVNKFPEVCFYKWEKSQMKATASWPFHEDDNENSIGDMKIEKKERDEKNMFMKN